MRSLRAFTLVEILIVVVILGILAAIVVPQFANATEQATSASTVGQLTKIRDAVSVYYVRNGNTLPQVVAGNVEANVGSWGEVMTINGDYMKKPPRNKWVDPANASTIVFGVGPDASYDPSKGWIYNPSTGDVWAAGFDGNDKPYPHP